VKFRSRSLAIYSNEFHWVVNLLAQKIIKTTESLKICYLFNTNCIYLKIVRRQPEMIH